MMWGSLNYETPNHHSMFQNAIRLVFPSEISKIATSMKICAALTRVGDIYIWNEDNGKTNINKQT